MHHLGGIFLKNIRLRGYLKHFNDSYTGDSISKALSKKAYLEIHLFWVIIERANQLGTHQFKEEIDYFCRVLFIRPTKFRRVSAAFPQYFRSISLKINGNFCEIFIDNYAKYQEKRGGKRDTKSESNRATLKIIDKRLKILYLKKELKNVENFVAIDVANNLNNHYVATCQSLGSNSPNEDWEFYNDWKKIIGVDYQTIKLGSFPRVEMRDKILNLINSWGLNEKG